MTESYRICTADNPMPQDAVGLWCHPDAKHLDDDYGSLASGGSYARYKCPHCGLTFCEQLAD